ncbi:hypothetical protein HBB16_07330 [Pseudonocardia sp. MCCB 268]|nr:hypothetical protein [Pseudonocardia cytotoxica]
MTWPTELADNVRRRWGRVATGRQALAGAAGKVLTMASHRGPPRPGPPERRDLHPALVCARPHQDLRTTARSAPPTACDVNDVVLAVIAGALRTG